MEQRVDLHKTERNLIDTEKVKGVMTVANKIRAVLIGDNSKAKYHPLQNVQEELLRILEGDVEVKCTEEYEILSSESLAQYDLCISYADRWDDKITSEQAAGLIRFVSGGRGFLVIHNGISLQSKYECAQLVGGKFTGHPPYQKLDFQVACPEHYIMQGIGDFTMEEEPYRFEMDSFVERQVLLQYPFGDDLFPAAWAHEYGMGRVVYLAPGHNKNSFLNAAYGEIIVRSARWASRREV